MKRIKHFQSGTSIINEIVNGLFLDRYIDYHTY
jgi:hypothetical protein